MARDRGARSGRQSLWVLAGLLVILAVVVGYQVGGRPSGPTASPTPADRRSPTQAEETVAPSEVHLGALEPAEDALTAPVRNPFRFQPAAAQTRTGGVPTPVPPSRPAAGLPSAGPGPTGQTTSPIPLKFIGVVEAEGTGPIAALSDGTFVYHGRAGDVIEGRYRIVEIGVESIVLERLDGGGRQTIRLTG